MAWQLLAAALPAAAQLAGTYLQKPDKKDYQPQTDYMKKYLGYIKGRSAQREVMHMAMQPQLRAIGRQGREMQQQVGYTAERSGVAGSGIEAQMRLSAGQATQEAMTTATEKAVAAQAAETARLGEKAELVTAQIGAEEQRAEQAYDTAGRQWKRQMLGDVLGAGASIASAGIGQKIQTDTAVSYAMSPTLGGMFGDEEKVRQMVKEGWTQEMFTSEANRMTNVINTYGKNSTMSDLQDGAEAYGGIKLDAQIGGVDLDLEQAEAGAMESAGMTGTPAQDFSYENIPSQYKLSESEWAVPPTGAEGMFAEEQAARIAGRKVTDPVEEGERVKTPRERLDIRKYGVDPKTGYPYGKSKDDYDYEDLYNEPEAEEQPKIAAEPEDKVVTNNEVKSVVDPKPVEEGEAAVTTVYKNKSYTIYNKDKTKSKMFRFTGNKTAGGKYVFKSDDGKRLDLTLEELNDRLKKKVK